MVAFLTPFSRRVRYCKIGYVGDSNLSLFIVGQILSDVDRAGISRTSNMIHLRATKSAPSASWCWPLHSVALPPRQATKPALPTRVLRLESILHSGSLSIYSDLAELYLEFPESNECRVSHRSISCILESSPALRVLSLINFTTTPEEEDSSPSPILSNGLQRLILISSSAETFTSILMILMLVKQPFSMTTVSVIPDARYLYAMGSFFGRLNTIDLVCTPSDRLEWFVMIPMPSPQQYNPIFEHFTSDNPSWETILSEYNGYLVTVPLQNSIYRITTSSHIYLFQRWFHCIRSYLYREQEVAR